MSTTVKATAVVAHEQGLCVVPIKTDGSKRPDLGSWGQYQETISTLQEIEAWFADEEDATGIGVVTGEISGDLELFEFDDGEVVPRFLARATEVGLAALVAQVRAGYCEQTPSGGEHWLYHLEGGGAKTTALARRPTINDRSQPYKKPLIETKGEGGFVIIAPSYGGVHPSGRPYQLISGGVHSIAQITQPERDALWSLARTFDELPKPALTVPAMKAPGRWVVKPGDAFAAAVDWPELLEPHGWAAIKDQGEATLWRRPGGYPGGWGASTNYAGSDLLYIWTSAAAPFVPDRAYSKFAAYTLLNHTGDFTAAAQALAEQGYGERAPEPPAASASSLSSTAALVAAAVVRQPVPPFPLEALPPTPRAFVAAGAAALGCPPDFVAIPLLVFCAAVAGNSRRLRIKLGFEVLPIFWAGVIGRPGTVKTPALNLSRSLLDVLQQEAWDRYEQLLEAWAAQDKDERGEKPRPEHFFATDTTTQAVAFALSSSRGIAIIHDELAGWVNAFDAYTKSGDRQYWLSAWSGQPLKPNRRSGEQLYIPEPVANITGGIQPEVLTDLAGEAKRDDGFLPRFLLVWPDAEPTLWSDAVMPEPVRQAMLAVVKRLRWVGEPLIAAFSPAAYAAWKDWYNENQRQLRQLTGIAAGWAAKAPTHLARLVLVLQMLTDPGPAGTTVELGTLEQGIVLLEYVRAHLARVLPVFGATASDAAAGLRPRIERQLRLSAPNWVARGDLAVRLGGHVPSQEIDAVLATFLADETVETRTISTSGRPRIEWRWRDDRPETTSPEQTPAADVNTWKREKGLDADLSTAFHVSTQQQDLFSTDAAEGGDGWEHWEEPA